MNSNTHFLFSIFLITITIKIKIIPVRCQEKPYILNCGASSTENDNIGRVWEPDTKFLDSSGAGDSKQVNAEVQDPSLPSLVPYMSARIFTSKSTYKIPVSRKQRLFLRLHFYPSFYQSYRSEDSYFAVTANGFSLLKNFSAFITTKALTLAYVQHEFCLTPVDSGHLDLTFTPSSDHSNTFAFVNGIEVIPVPEIFRPALMLGFDSDIDVTDNSFQTMYRLNVGGNFISAVEDKLNRTWYDDMPYLSGAGFGVASSVERNVTVKYAKEVTEDIAPLQVYNTARSMGSEASLNQKYNLTWVFQVDSNFTYLLRCHFCEFKNPKVNQRVFDIFINNQTAEEDVDIVFWAGGLGRTTYKDYAVSASDGDEIWLALHPAEDMDPEFFDSFLNGLEIFKINDENQNLAGPNPKPSDMLLKDEEKSAESSRKFSQQKSDKRATETILGGVAGGAAGFTIVAVVAMIIIKKKKRGADGKISGGSAWLPIYGTKSTVSGSKTGGGSTHLSTMAAGLCRHFSLAEIKSGTKHFAESNVIGVGGFGKVYKGVVDKSTMVAIKRSNPSSEQGVHEFETEIEMLSKLRHKHLVSLIGFCEEGGEMILVYDYMANGTLREHLYNSKKPPLTWEQRLDICIGSAKGLHYLHTGAKYTIIHRDVKTTNILLDEKWVAKVSDFGLSKTGPDLNKTHVSTMVKGSFGYLDPEYFRRQQLTEKSDVYSFGVVLFEVLCARPALNPSLPKEQVSLADWALRCQRKGCLDELIDPLLKGKIKPDCLKTFADTAEKCLSDNGTDRPSMGDVLWNLEYASKLQQEDMDSSSVSRRDEEDGPPGDTLSAVFSQMANPTGR